MREIYFNESYELPDAERNKMNLKYDPVNLNLNEYDYTEWYNEKYLDDLSWLEDDEGEVKEKKRIR